jgi:basic membrane protein A and related proteins
MKRTKFALAALLLTIATATVALVAATAGSAKHSDVFKVAWIYVGPHNDAGWSQAHDEGRLAVVKALGSKVQTTYKENIAPGPQLQQTVASLVQQGYKMIFGTSYGFFDKKLAAKYPGVLFEQATGTDTARTSRNTSAQARTRSTSRAWRQVPPARLASSVSSSLTRFPK